MAKAADYKSDELTYLLGCISDRKEKLPEFARHDPQDDNDDDNMVSNFSLIKSLIYLSGTFGRY